MPTCPSCGATLEAQGGVCLKCGGATMADTRQRTSLPTGTMDEGRFPPGTVLAQRYRIVSLLGRGGMGEVYRANDLLLGQTVALKFLPPAFSSNEELLNRFRSEVRIARMVSHPNVCRVFDIGEVDGSTYLSMEYVDGEDLSSLLRRIGALPRDKALEIAREICAGLAAAHAKGVIHRDLKPANIMIDGQGQARVTDFGLAGFAEQVRDIRSGTPAYMAPEQRAGTQVTSRSDIYALGIVLHELLTGKRPDEKGSKVALEPAVDQVVQRCLAADPEKRPASALAVSAALPGGDPLAIALAAGETPTPEMVADAGGAEGMQPMTALLCLAAVVLMLAGAAILQQRRSILSLMPLELPPQILASKARELARSFGYTRAPLTTVARWRRDDSYLEHMETRADAASRPARLRGNRPPAMYFWYRESPAPMLAPPSGEIQRFDPPISAPGMLMLTLDSEGRLLEFRGRPWPAQNESARAADWSPLLAAAGLDPTKLKSVPPEWAPEMPCDAQAAWIGAWPGLPGEPLRVEAGLFRGQPVYFSAAGRWPHDSGPEESVPGLRIVIATALIVSVLAIPIIRRNVRLGRGDGQGAFRLACFVCLCSYGLRAMHHTHSWTAAEIEVQLDAVAYGVVWALICGMMYLAFEPTVRRRAPERLFAWNRLLAGKFSDPLLGRHVLVGVVFGCAVNLLAPFTVAPLTMALTPTADWSGSLTRILWPALMAVGSGMACTLLLLLFRIVARRDWAATVLLVAVLFLLRGPLAAPGQTTLWALTLARSVLMVYLLLRFGLLPMIVAGFISGVLGYAPLTTHLSAWYARDALVAFAITLALAVYGYRTTLAGRPVFGKRLAEDVLG